MPISDNPISIIDLIFPRQIADTYLPTQMGWIACVDGAHHVMHNLLSVNVLSNPKTRQESEPR